METTLQKQSLYQIREDHLMLLYEIEESDGILTEEQENALSLTQEQFQDKAISYAFVIKKFDDNEEIIEREIARLQALKEWNVKRKELFKQRLSEAMLQFGFEKITTPLISLSFRKSESVNITNESVIPSMFTIEKYTYTPDKAMIKQALKAGEAVPGAELVMKQNLQIK